jgi:hypothetical protein
MKNPWFLPAATLLLGAAAGYISGKIRLQPNEGKLW